MRSLSSSGFPAQNTLTESTLSSGQKPQLQTLPAAEAPFRTFYIPALDGLRALSILLVMGVHEIGPVSSALGHEYNGWIGVDVFFVISGFLITSILFAESSKKGGSIYSGKFSLKNFYLRRWLRLCPTYYSFLALVAGWYVLGGDHHVKPFVCAALYLTNLDIAYGWNLIAMKPFLTHLWSLGLEEQFYVAWPACLKFVKKQALPFVVACLVIVYFWRLYLVSTGAPWFRIINGFDTEIDVLLTGVLTALLLARPRVAEISKKTLGNPFAQVLITVLMFQCFKWINPPFDVNLNEQLFFWAFKKPLTTIWIAVLIVSVLSGPKAPVARVLSTALMVCIGKLSYSLYLWHPVVHLIYSAFNWNFVCKHPVYAEFIQYALIFAVGTLSYWVIERPFLIMKKKFS